MFFLWSYSTVGVASIFGAAAPATKAGQSREPQRIPTTISQLKNLGIAHSLAFRNSDFGGIGLELISKLPI